MVSPENEKEYNLVLFEQSHILRLEVFDFKGTFQAIFISEKTPDPFDKRAFAKAVCQSVADETAI